MKRLILFTILLLLVASLGLGCGSSSSGSGSGSFDIVHQYWGGENLDPSFLINSGGSADFSCAVNFQTKYSGNITANDIDKITITAITPNIQWNCHPQPGDIDSTNKVIFCNRLWVTGNPHAIPIGDYRVDIFLKNNSTPKSAIVTFGTPASTSTNGKNYLYTEEYGAGAPDGYDTMLKRAISVSASKTATNLTVHFTTNDTRVYNEYLWFYNGSKNYIGSSSKFKDIVSNINTDNTDNSITFENQYIKLDSSYTLSDIKGIHVLLVDGVQYTPNSAWDYRSVSSYAEVTGP